MTRNKLALFVSAAYHAFDMVPEVHDAAISHGIISHDSCDIWSIRRLERLPKLSLCVILCDIVSFATVFTGSRCDVITSYAKRIDDALFSVDPPFAGGFDSLLNSESTPKPVWGLLSSLARESGLRDGDITLLSHVAEWPHYSFKDISELENL